MPIDGLVPAGRGLLGQALQTHSGGRGKADQSPPTSALSFSIYMYISVLSLSHTTHTHRVTCTCMYTLLAVTATLSTCFVVVSFAGPLKFFPQPRLWGRCLDLTGSPSTPLHTSCSHCLHVTHTNQNERRERGRADCGPHPVFWPKVFCSVAMGTPHSCPMKTICSCCANSVPSRPPRLRLRERGGTGVSD